MLVAAGGGGLIGGICAWYRSRIRIVAVEPALAPALTEAMRAGHPVDAPPGGIAADSLAPRRVGDLMFPLAQAHVAQVICVDDDEIRATQRQLWNRLRILSEPGGAAAMAALLSKRYRPERGERVAVLLGGANTDAATFEQ